MNNDGTPSASYRYRKLREISKSVRIGTNIVKNKTNSKKNNYTTEYQLRKDAEEKKVIDEINRQNLYSDYGV